MPSKNAIFFIAVWAVLAVSMVVYCRENKPTAERIYHELVGN